MFARFFRKIFNAEPAMMISALLATAAVAIPVVVVPYRRARGLPTYQWDGTAENPVRASQQFPHRRFRDNLVRPPK